MRPFGFLLLAAVACGAPDLSLSPEAVPPGADTRAPQAEPPVAGPASAGPIANFAALAVQPANLDELPPDGPFGPAPAVFADTGCRFKRPPFEKAPEPVPAPRLCAAGFTSGGNTEDVQSIEYDALGRPVAGRFSSVTSLGGFATSLDARGRVIHSRSWQRSDLARWYRYDEADVERIAVRTEDAGIEYAVASIAPDCRSIRWQWWSRDRSTRDPWAQTVSRVEEFDQSGVLVAVEQTREGTRLFRTTFLYHPNGVVAREETSFGTGTSSAEFDLAGRLQWREEHDASGLLTSRTELGYDTAGRRVYEVRIRNRTVVVYRYTASYDASGHLLRSSELQVRDSGEQTTDLALQWSGVLLLREDRASTTAGGTSTRAQLHSYDRRGLRTATKYDDDGDGSFDDAISRFAYDAAGRLVLEDHRSRSAVESYRRTYEYDAAGNKTRERTTYSDGRVEESSWSWCE